MGSTLLDQAGEENCYFQWKHHFIVHTLEDGVLAEALSGIRERRRICMEVKGSRSGRMSSLEGVPLKILSAHGPEGGIYAFTRRWGGVLTMCAWIVL